MGDVEEDNMQLVEREGTYELVDTKSLSAARLLEEEAGRESIQLPDGPEPEANAPAQATSEVIASAAPVSEAPITTETPAAAPAVVDAPVVIAPATLPITPSETTKKVLYTPYERSTPVPQSRSKSAGSKKSIAKREQEEIEKKQMAEAAFSHWKREKDNETLKKRREKADREIALPSTQPQFKTVSPTPPQRPFTAKITRSRGKQKSSSNSLLDIVEESQRSLHIKKKKESKTMKAEVDKAWHDPYKPTDRDSPAFKSWLQEKSRQRAAEREIEKLRAQLITAELLTVDYEQTEGAYERWLKEKNKKTRNDKQERDRRSSRDKAQLKQVISSLKTRWTADYNRSQYLHPNAISAYDNTNTIACMDDY